MVSITRISVMWGSDSGCRNPRNSTLSSSRFLFLNNKCSSPLMLSVFLLEFSSSLSDYHIYLSTCLPVYMSSCLPVFLSTCLPVYLPTCLPVYLSTCLLVYKSACLPAYMSTCLPAYLPTCLPVYLSTCLPVHLSTWKRAGCGNIWIRYIQGFTVKSRILNF